MLTLLSQARFWTVKDDIIIKDTDYGAYKYHEKKDQSDTLYYESKKSYAEKRGLTWTVKNRRPNKLKDSIKELDEQLSNHRVVYCQWRDDCLVQLMFSTGLLVNICVDITTGDILKMSFDKFLIGKLWSDYVVDVVITKTHIVCSYNDNQLTLVYFTKPSTKINVPEKLSRMEPRLQTVELAGPNGRRLERRLSANTNGDTVLVWWRCGRDEVYPWSPIVRDQDRANVHVYSINGIKAQLLCWYRTEHDPVCVSFSLLQPSLILSLEQKVSRKGEVTVESGRYEVSRARLQRTAVTSVPLQTQVCCHSFSPGEDKLLLGCIDGSLVLFDEGRGVTHLAKAAFISTLVSWHPEGSLILAANEQCQFQCFDAALAGVRHELVGEDSTPGVLLDLAAYCKLQPTVLHLAWSRRTSSFHHFRFKPTDSLLLILLDRGPLAVLRITGGGGCSSLGVEVLVTKYLSLDLVERATALLLTLSWDTSGSSCLSCLQKIVEHLLRKPLNTHTAGLLQTALGCFHMPLRPMSPATELQYADQVHDLTRRFFHQLLRYQLFEKAFRLAIDLQVRDLFVDIYFYACALNANVMAAAAREKAQQLLNIDTNCATGSPSGSSSCSCSGSTCGSSEGDEEEEVEEISVPPPLPTAKPYALPNNRVGEKQKVKFSDTVTHIGLPDTNSSEETSTFRPASSAPLRYVPASVPCMNCHLPDACGKQTIDKVEDSISHTPVSYSKTSPSLSFTKAINPDFEQWNTRQLVQNTVKPHQTYTPRPGLNGSYRMPSSHTLNNNWNKTKTGYLFSTELLTSLPHTSSIQKDNPVPNNESNLPSYSRFNGTVHSPQYKQEPSYLLGNSVYSFPSKGPVSVDTHFSYPSIVNSQVSFSKNSQSQPLPISRPFSTKLPPGQGSTYKVAHSGAQANSQKTVQTSSLTYISQANGDQNSLIQGRSFVPPQDICRNQDGGMYKHSQDSVTDEEESLPSGNIKVIHFGVV